MRAERVRCVVCGRTVAGRVPAGGAGSLLMPVWHLWIGHDGQACPGRFDEGVPVVDNEPPGRVPSEP